MAVVRALIRASGRSGSVSIVEHRARRSRAQPSIETTLGGSGLSRTIGFRVRDSDSGNPIPEATLSVRADDGGGSSVTGEVTSVQPELFRVKVDFPRPGRECPT